ncbi:oxidoreductase [Sphingomonas ginkgonis]|nr:oxidoreductase [Sphingomonas ginkgonis]
MLARGGVAATLVERRTEPHDVVCGGFLGWDTLATLERLKLDIFSLGARPITRLRLVSGRHVLEVGLPRQAAGFSRKSLDAALLSLAGAGGATVRRGFAIRDVDPATRTARLEDGEELTAEGLFLATGKHELRGLARPPDFTREGAVGLRTVLRGGLQGKPLDGCVELHLFDGGYAGLLMQEDGSSNLCLSVTKKRFSRAKSPGALVKALKDEAPLLGERVGHEDERHWQAIAGVPYGWRADDTRDGLFRLGDQAAVISSLAGDGVAIALQSGISAAKAFLRDGPSGAAAYQTAFSRQTKVPLGLADLLRGAAERPLSRPILMRLAAVPGLASWVSRLTRIT